MNIVSFQLIHSVGSLASSERFILKLIGPFCIEFCDFNDFNDRREKIENLNLMIDLFASNYLLLSLLSFFFFRRNHHLLAMRNSFLGFNLP